MLTAIFFILFECTSEWNSNCKNRFWQSNAKSKSELKYANKIVKWIWCRKCLKFVCASAGCQKLATGIGMWYRWGCWWFRVNVALSANYWRENFRPCHYGHFLPQRLNRPTMRASNQSVNTNASKYAKVHHRTRFIG